MQEDQATRVISALKAKLDGLRPVSGDALKQLDAWYDVKMTYTSNAIEGNTLSHSETQIVVEKGITIGGKTIKEHLEARDLFAATKAMRDMARTKAPVTERDLLDLHALILRGSEPGTAGRYADVQRRVTGSDVVFPRPEKIPGLMDGFSERLRDASGWTGAVEAHFDLVTIHPFNDGNGRTARLLMNLLLLKDGYPPVLIGKEERAAYVECIGGRQRAEPLGHGIVDAPSRAAYRSFMADRVIASLTEHLEGMGLDLGDGGGKRVDGTGPGPVERRTDANEASPAPKGHPTSLRRERGVERATRRGGRGVAD